MKDLDFKRKLNLTPEAREIFLAQIDHDSSVGTTLLSSFLGFGVLWWYGGCSS